MNDIIPENWVIVWNKKEEKSFGLLRMLNICPVSRNKSHPEDTWDPYEIIPGAGGHLLWLGKLGASPPFFINLSLCLGR